MKAKTTMPSDDMRAEYDFDYSKTVRGKYYRRLLKEGANVVVLEPDVAKAFRSSAAVNEALERTEMDTKRNDAWQSLSGGEKQRAHLARALAQSPKELILDEPTNHLDVHHQISLLRLVSELPVTSIIALHDLNHAAMYCDHLIVLDKGKVVTSGTPERVMTQDLLRDVFSVDAVVEASRFHGRPHIQFLR